MKKLMIAALVVAMSSAAMAKNTGEKAANVRVRTNLEDTKMDLIYLDDNPSTVKVTIKDPNGKVIKKDIIRNAKGFKRPYDLSNLSTGIYTIEMADEEGTFYETSAVVNNSISAVKPSGSNKFQLTFEKEGKQHVKVGIFDSNGDLIHKDNVMSIGGFSRIYDLSKFGTGGFTFEVISDGKVETHEI